MATPLRLLIVEDNLSDAELMLHTLRRADFEPIAKRVDTEQGYRNQLQSVPEIILADFSMPSFDALRALEIMQECKLDIPFILVSGSIGEERAVQVIQLGATDYVLKDRIDRLGPAVSRALTEAKERQKRRQAEDSLRESEKRFRRLFESAKDGILILDAETGMIADVNPFLVELLGYSRETFLGKRVWELGFFKDLFANQIKFIELQHKGYVRYENLALETRDGRRVEVEFVSNVYSVEHQKIIQCNIRDITERKRAEATVRESNERFRQIAASIHEVFWITTPDFSQTIYVSPSYETIWGRKCQDLYNSPQDWMESIHKEDQMRVKDATSKILDEIYDVEYRIIQPGGAVRWIRARGAPVRDAAGRVFRIAGVAEDITERRQLERQLQVAQKLEALGLLAGGVAHDFNNLLTIISGYSQLILMKIPTDDPLHKSITAISDAGGRAASLTRQMLAFSRQTVVEPQILEINVAVKETGKMLHRLIGEDIILTMVLEPKIKRVKIDPGQLNQILMNLSLNARDAMPQGGKLTIESRNIELDDAYARTHPEVHPGSYVMVAVSDSGSGMPLDVQARIFEPFFTTKGVGKGTGLGLAVVHGIVKQSGGHIAVYSELNIGTTFKVYLPAVEEKASKLDAPNSDVDLSGTETILLVEDEDSVRTLAALILQGKGYKILNARNGKEALKVLEQNPETIDLLATDVIMPEMNGRELAELLGKQFPKLKVMYMSGYTDDAVVRHGILHAEVAFLQKPYTPIALLMKIRQVLDQEKDS